MSDLFLWELGTPRVYAIWLLVFLAQIAVAEINRRWNWTVFALWTVGGLILMPYAAFHGTPMVGWFPFGKYVIMVLTATMNGVLIVYCKRNPVKAHRYAIWLGVALWVGLAANIMEANIRDLTIFAQRDSYYACAANWQCLQDINNTHTIDMIAGLPEARGVTAPLHSQEWYSAVATNLAAHGVGIDPATGFRTIGGYWNLMSALAGLLNIITITGLGKIFVTSRKGAKVRGLIWVDMVWPWVVAYDLWNHAFLYNALGDYTWYCTLALLLACTIPAFTWAKGQWIWFRCYTLMFWIACNNLLPEILVPPNGMTNFATMDPTANIVCSGAALAANVILFGYWLWKILKHKRNPLTNVLYPELAEFRAIMNEHADDKDKYFVTDMIKETPYELGFEPTSTTPPRDGYVGHMPWWGRTDKRYPKLRTPVAADPGLVDKGVISDSQWDVPTPEQQSGPVEAGSTR
ncbi:hypothetical protein KEM60_01057 [Austwickia sp. TVS 96-490-7B]|uniref:DUF5692 family protein n=1 Tax=Austwickia sp. TVS 96-490-7B TaxID=2830843 RepID=UPI001C563E94|nr:DUF5692 family protein [Austwickia sp. TVS 96-490-7B]MBW3084868.1 hypothetical protein [Austwickia sp. TVS 96-490-7B]